MGDDEGRTLELLDDVGHGEGLAAAGDAHKSLGVKSLACAFHQAVDGLRLVSRRPEVGGYLEGPLFGADHGESNDTTGEGGGLGATSRILRSGMNGVRLKNIADPPGSPEE